MPRYPEFFKCNDVPFAFYNYGRTGLRSFDNFVDYRFEQFKMFAVL